jgi:hypothetical protein
VFGYCISGLSVLSDMPLPGLIPAMLQGAPQVEILAAPLPDAFDAPEAVGPNWQLSGDRLLIEAPGVVRMLLTGGRTLNYAMAPGAAAEDAAIFLSATGFGILLQQRGRIVLHASAVRVGTDAVLFCGASGAGKSTLAAALGNQGYPLVADDFCSVTLRDDRPWVEADARQHKLWRQAIDRLSLDARGKAAVRPNIAKYHVEPPAVSGGPLPVAAVYGLQELRPPRGAGIDRPNRAEAMLLVRGNAYRPRLVAPMGQRRLYFDAAASIVRHAGVFTLTRRLDFAVMDEVIGWLEGQWGELRLLQRAV